MDEKTKEKAPPRAPKTFLQTLQDHHWGHTASEATAKLQECIDASERTGKVTELTIKMKFKPVSKQQGRYDVLVDVDNKLPAKEREAAIMFVGPDGNLTNRDPRQQEIVGLRPVENESTVRVADEPQVPGLRVTG